MKIRDMKVQIMKQRDMKKQDMIIQEMRIREKWYFGLGQHERSTQLYFQLQVKSLSILNE